MPAFEDYYKACLKDDREAKAVAVSTSAVRAIADASEVTGLPRDSFEVHEISKAELKAFDLLDRLRIV
jgi:hypothetical protein